MEEVMTGICVYHELGALKILLENFAGAELNPPPSVRPTAAKRRASYNSTLYSVHNDTLLPLKSLSTIPRDAVPDSRVGLAMACARHVCCRRVERADLAIIYSSISSTRCLAKNWTLET